MLEIQYKQVDSLIPYIGNARTHSDEQVSQVAASIKEFGFTNPILLDEDNGIIAGHGRLLAAQKMGMADVPTIELTGLSDTQRKAYVLADNKLAMNAGWDIELLSVELKDLESMGADLSIIGFDDDELAELLSPEQAEGLTDKDDIPEIPDDPVTVEGDIWILGNHRLICGDSTSIDAVEKLMDGKRAQLIHADPPYGMGKEGDGVANDNLYREKLDSFQMEWWGTLRTFVVDNGSAYIWGNAADLWRLWYDGGLGKSENLTFRNQIIWNKKNGQGMGSDKHRQFPTVSEHCLFFMLGEQGFNNNADNYWDGFEPIRKYLYDQRESIGWNNKIVAAFFGFHPRMADHWFSKSQWSFPQKEQYERLQAESAKKAFSRDYDDLKQEHDDLKQEHDDLKQEFYGTRAFFDNSHELMTDIWDYKRVSGDERHGHATPKPVEMMKRVMFSSLKNGGICIEPFGGSGSTLMAAEITGRICYIIELQPKYCDVIIKRWQAFTGNQAKHIDGREFEEMNDVEQTNTDSTETPEGESGQAEDQQGRTEVKASESGSPKRPKPKRKKALESGSSKT